MPSIGTPKTTNFPFVPNGKLLVLGVPIFKNIRVRVHCIRCIDTLNLNTQCIKNSIISEKLSGEAAIFTREINLRE